MAKRRKPGSGSVFKRKDGRWEGRVVVGYKENGYPQTKNVTAKTKAECLEKLERLKEQCGSLRSDSVKPNMPFGVWLMAWYESYCKPKIKESTQESYEQQIELHIITEIGHIPLNELTQSDLQQFYARLKQSGRKRLVERFGEGLSDRMVRKCHSICSAALEKAKEMGLIRSNPAVGCKLPPKKAKEMQVLTREEMQRLLIQAKEQGYYELFLLELATGMRRGEILALQWNDLNLATGELHINKQVGRIKGELVISDPKTKAAVRTIVLPPSVTAVLAEYKKSVDSRWIFPSPVKEDSPLDPGKVRTKLVQILENAGCKRIRFHDLRHTFSTLALKSGMDAKTLSSVIGHQSAATTLDIYAHITSDMQRAAAVNIDRSIGRSNQKGEAPPQAEAPVRTMTDFQPYKGKYRKPGQGCVSQINDHLWEGRYSPTWVDGKRKTKNVYAHSREECEEKLAAVIAEMKAEREQLKKEHTKTADL